MSIEKIKFYPISYHTQDIYYQLSIIIFAYNDKKEKITVRVPYNYWFYAIIKDKSYNEIKDIIEQENPNIVVESEDKIEIKYSTAKHHDLFKTIKIRCNSSYDKYNI